MINREEYGEILTKLKRVQRENERLRGQLEMAQREKHFAEERTLRFTHKWHTAEQNLAKTQALLKVCLGT